MLGTCAVILALLSARVNAEDCQLKSLIPTSDKGTCTAKTTCDGTECNADLAGVALEVMGLVLSVPSGTLDLTIQVDSCTGDVKVNYVATGVTIVMGEDKLADNRSEEGIVDIPMPEADTAGIPSQSNIALVTEKVEIVTAGIYLQTNTQLIGNTVTYDHSVQMCYEIAGTTACGDGTPAVPFYDFAVLRGSFEKIFAVPAGADECLSFSLAKNAGLTTVTSTVKDDSAAATTNDGAAVTEVPDSASGLHLSFASVAVAFVIRLFF